MADIRTVGDLIEELSKLPADKPIVMYDSDSDKRTVKIVDDPYFDYVSIEYDDFL